jgi:hypothetical protein
LLRSELPQRSEELPAPARVGAGEQECQKPEAGGQPDVTEGRGVRHRLFPCSPGAGLPSTGSGTHLSAQTGRPGRALTANHP